MSMRSSTAPRRIYTRSGTNLLCFGGLYFAPPGKGETKINPEREVHVEVLDRAGGKAHVEVSQKVGGKKVAEKWNEKHIEFGSRA